MDKNELKHKVIAIALLAKDCQKTLSDNIKRIEELGEHFGDYCVVAYENDSKDDTKAILQTWSIRNRAVTAITEDNVMSPIQTDCSSAYPDKSLTRIAKMAMLRNRLLQEVKKKCKPDYYCLLDADIRSFDVNGVVNAIVSAPADWGGLFANGAEYAAYSTHVVRHFVQYDSYAYVDYDADPYKSGNWTMNKDFHIVTGSRMTWKLNRHKILPCHSAFNGLAVYQWDAVKNNEYTLRQTEEMKAANTCMCEHVPFNMNMIAQGYCNYIMRDMVVVYGYLHPKEYKGIGRWKNYHRAFHFFVNRPRQTALVLIHFLKQKWGIYPYIHI